MAWGTEVSVINLADKVNFDWLLTRVMMDVTSGQGMVDERSVIEESSQLYRWIEENIQPYLIEYVEEHFGSLGQNYDVTLSTWVMSSTNESVGLESHGHDNAVVSSVFYLEIKDGVILFEDPRSHASRGYPKGLKTKHFGNLRILPNAGDLVIFPSYLKHSVGPHTEFRIAIPVDLIVRERD